MTYDQWKTTDPADRYLDGPVCEWCDRPLVEHKGIWFCEECDPPEEDEQ